MNTNSSITFGKFSGWTAFDLAKAGSSGRSYLSWGANNLKSPQWRQVFQDALSAPIITDLNLAARALMVDDPEIGIDEAMYIVREQEAERAEDARSLAAWEASRSAVAAEYAARTGKTAQEMESLAKRFENSDWENIPMSYFSSPAARSTFMQFMAAWSAASESEVE